LGGLLLTIGDRSRVRARFWKESLAYENRERRGAVSKRGFSKSTTAISVAAFHNDIGVRAPTLALFSENVLYKRTK